MLKDECLRVVEKTFADGNTKDMSLSVKLKRVKAALKNWNGSYEDLSSRVSKLEKRINEIEQRRDIGDLDRSSMEELKYLNIELWDCLKVQEDLWRQKA
ncbi:hypothetical protein V6N13_072821 [Hibiscus sabdariffa]